MDKIARSAILKSAILKSASLKSAILSLWIVALFAPIGKADNVFFSSGGAISVSVPITGTAAPAGFDAYGTASAVTNNIFQMSEQEETASSYVTQRTSQISKLDVFVVVSSSLPEFGDQTSPGAVLIEFRIRRANTTSGFNDTVLGVFSALPAGLYSSTRLQAVNMVDSVLLNVGDRITLQTRVSCPSGCPNNVYLLIGFSGSIYLAPLQPQQVCPDNAVCVDPVQGNNALGSRGGMPFATINAALSNALAGDLCWIYPGNYSETFTIPRGVAVRGLSRNVVTILLTNPQAPTDIVTMGIDTRLEDVTIRMVSSFHAQVRGIFFPSQSAQNSQVTMVTINLDNSAANTTGTSDILGVYVQGLGAASETVPNLNSVFVHVASTGFGNKRGVQVDFQFTSIFVIRNSAFQVLNSSATSSSIGGETFSAVSTMRVYSGSFSGQTADISQTRGTIALDGTRLRNSRSNDLAFTVLSAATKLFWGFSGTFGNSQVRNWFVGTETGMNTAVNTPAIFFRIPKTCVVMNLGITQTNTAIAAAEVFTVIKTFGPTITGQVIVTPLTATFQTGRTTANSTNVAVTFNEGDFITLQSVSAGAGPHASNPQMSVDLY